MIHMNDIVKRIGRFIIVPIKKPFNELSEANYDYVGVNKEYFEEAKRYSRFLVVWSPNGEIILMPKGFKPTKKFKKTYLYENNPMTEWGVKVPHGIKHDLEWFEYPRGEI